MRVLGLPFYVEVPFLFSVNLYNFSKITLQVHTAYT
nr:MAG TPA: hypothetical protein [Caudoviricetes sp.]